MLRQGDIVLIPIPFSNLSSLKRRPVLILSSTQYNQRNQDIVVAAITSNITDREFQVVISTSDMNEGKLKVNSAIRADKIYTLSQEIVVKKFGNVKDSIMKKVKLQIDGWFDSEEG